MSLLNPALSLSQLTRKFGSEKPLLVKSGFLRFFVFANPEHINIVFRNSKRTTNKFTTLFALRNIFNLPKSAVRFYQADDSGASLTPRKGSSTAPENRIKFLIANNLKKFMSPDHLEALDQRYLTILHRYLDALEVDSEWITFPDLYTFVQHAAVGSITEALCGTALLEIYPQFVEDLLVFQSRIPDFASLLPSWLIPEAIQVRKRLLDGIKRWHQFASEHSDFTKVGPEDPEWEPYFGSKIVRTRQLYTSNIEAMGPDACATEDLGLIFTSTSNLVVSIFWFILEALKDPHLLQELMKEVSECGSSDNTQIDIKRLTTQPLLQSTYAEVLRLFIAGVVSRVAEYEDISIAGYTIPKDSYLIMYSRTMALNYDAWTQAGRTIRKPLEEFDAERFLVSSSWTRPGFPRATDARRTSTEDPIELLSKRRFSLDGLLGIWIPYGGGDHICPGRQFAKHGIVLTFAVLLSKFDFELTSSDTSKIQPDMKFAPFGALPPTCNTPFRIRRRVKM